MRIDNLCLFLEVESFAILRDDRVLVPVLEVTLIAGPERFRIRVPHKAIGYAHLSLALKTIHGVPHQSLLHVFLCR